MNRSTFHAFLVKQLDRRDRVGDFARVVIWDQDFSRYHTTYEEVGYYVLNSPGILASIRDFDAAWKAYTAPPPARIICIEHARSVRARREEGSSSMSKPWRHKGKHRRLDDLAFRFDFRGCDVCINWSLTALVRIDGVTNQEVSRDRPKVCPNCGTERPILHEIHLVDVDVHQL